MSARELHRYVRTGKKRISFGDIKPFIDENKHSLITPARALAHVVGKKRKNGRQLSDKTILFLGLLKEKGILINPLNLDVCVQIDANELKVDGIPFNVYFHHLSGSYIGGIFLDTNDKPTSSVFLSLTIAIHLFSSYLASNNLEKIRTLDIGRKFLLQRYKDGSLHRFPEEKVIELSHQLLGTRLFEKEISRLFDGNTLEAYVRLVEATLTSIAVHEAAHVLHKAAGILGDGGVEKEEMRAYLTEMAYGNPGLVFPYLPINKEKDDPNCKAGRAIMKELFKRCDFGHLMRINKQQISELAKEMLDDDFRSGYGMHHDGMVPRIEIEKVRRHRFFSESHFPMFESLRYLPKKAA